MTKLVMTPLIEVLQQTYDIDGEMLINLEVFINKHYTPSNIADFIKFPETMKKLLEKVVYDEWNGFSYIYDWHRVAIGTWDEPGEYELIHVSGYGSSDLFWLKNFEEIDYSELEVF